jgi:phosphate regulon transcriptional regulator PhoB
MAAKILVVEDEAPLAEMLRYNLAAEGFEVAHAETGEEAELMLAEEQPDLVVLDWMLPAVSGIELCRRLRARPETRALPILMLTARGEEADRVRGLDTGADDYVTKPFSPREIVARVRAVLRRLESKAWLRADETQSGLRVDGQTRRAHYNSQEIELTRVEFDLLTGLMEKPGRVYTRAQLIDRVWGDGYAITDRTVDSHVKSLRRKLAEVGGDPGMIETVRGVGYRIGDEVTREDPQT